MKTLIRKKERGFTFVEMMVVIAMIGILLAIAIPAFSSWLPDYRLRMATWEIFINLKAARTGAINTNSEWRIYFNTNDLPGTCTIYSNSGEDRIWDCGGDDKLAKFIDLSEFQGVKFGKPANVPKIGKGYRIDPESTYQITDFTPRGTVNHRGYIYLTNNKGTCYAVGTPRPAGIVVVKKWIDGIWK